MSYENDLLGTDVAQPLLGGPSFTLRNRVVRAIWGVTWFVLASWTPKVMRPWRVLLLRAFGADIALDVEVRGSARVWYPPNLVMHPNSLISEGVTCYNMATIEVGSDVIVSHGAHLCAGSHDIDGVHFRLVAKPIRIGARAWIASEAFVGPGVQVAEGAVLGARSVAFRNLRAWSVNVGNPCIDIRDRRQLDR